MPSQAVLKLNAYQHLSDDAMNDIEATLSRHVKIDRNAEIATQGDDEAPIWALLEGWACRYVILANGERQIVGLMTAGDFCDTRNIRLAVRNFGTMAMTNVTIASVAPSRFKAILDRHRDVVVALAKAQLADESIMQTWIANMARKTARERMAHLLCEMVTRVSRSTNRLNMVIRLPFIQLDFADILGMSAVHVNRVLKGLRDDQLVFFQSKWLEVRDYPKLVALADFDASYLYYNEGSQSTARG